MKKLEFSVINNSEFTIVCNEARKEQIMGSNPKKLIVIHNSPVKSLKGENSNPKSEYNNSLVISYVGGLTETRFIEELLEVVSENPEINLEIAGFGSLSSLVLKYHNQYGNINFHGQVSYTESLTINEKSNLMIAMYDPKIKNNQYSAPNKIYEAMYFGKAIIVAEGTGVDTMVEKEKIGFISSYNKESFTEILENILSDNNLLEVYSQNAKEKYSKYSWDKMRLRLLTEYNKLQ